MAREQLKTHDIPADKLQGLTQCVMTTSKGDITIELFPKDAPNTVANFYTLASDGFYDGLAFHRVIPGFVAQGGCPEGTGAGERRCGTGGPAPAGSGACAGSARRPRPRCRCCSRRRRSRRRGGTARTRRR